MKTKKVIVDWSDPRTYDSVFYSPRIQDIGLYCLSRKYGNNETLLYIGKTNHSFYSRLSSHQFWFEQYKGKLFVRLGIITQPSKYDNELIEDIESAIIYEIKPLENTDKINGYTCWNVCEIENSGYRGLLPRIIDMRNHGIK